MNIQVTIPGTGKFQSDAAFNIKNRTFEIRLGDSRLCTLAYKLKSSLHGHLQSCPMDTAKLAPIISNSPTKLQKIANKTKSAFKTKWSYIYNAREKLII